MEKLMINEKEYELKAYLPLMDKYDMAAEAASLMYNIDEDLGIVYRLHTSDMTWKLLILKYYAGFDISELDSFEAQCTVIDQISYNDGTCLLDSVEEDTWITLSILDDLIEAVKARVERENSIGYRALKAFGSLLTGEDIVSVLSDAQNVNENLLTMVEKVKVAETKPQKDVSLGNVLSFAKKEKK